MRMKKTMLLVSSSPSTSVGLRSYLTHIFGRYIKLEARLADDVTSELMEQFDLVLFASKGAARALETSMTPKIHFLICIRTFNFTYLNKILSIPPNSDVYLVNDSEQTTKSAIRLLSTYGFSQYHFVPYYPGCGEADYSIQYAVTLGEERYVPRHIPNVMDIGVRVADVSTIAEIASFFNLSMSIADVVTQNYLNQFVQLLKMSNYQVRQTTNMNFITQSIIHNIDIGVCMVNKEHVIIMVNNPFVKELEIQKPHLVGVSILEAVPEFEEILKKHQESESLTTEIIRHESKKVMVTLQKIRDANHEDLTLIHLGRRMIREDSAEDNGLQIRDGVLNPEQKTETWYQFRDYRSENTQVLRMLEMAKRISLTDYRVLIQGETGTGKEVLAQAIHNNSSRCRNAFVKVNLSAMSELQAAKELDTAEENSAARHAQGGTLYLDGIHNLTQDLQRVTLGLLDSPFNVRLIASTDQNLYEMSREGLFLRELFYRMNEVSLATLPVRERPEDIPLLFEYFMRNIYNTPSLTWRELFSDGLWEFLMGYCWPGNGKEIENLCKYFYCVKSDRKLTERDLPPYILSQIRENEEHLSPLERQVLIALSQNPKKGRAALLRIVREQGVDVTEGKIRRLLQDLSDRGLVRTNRTKGGCEITGKGETFL